MKITLLHYSAPPVVGGVENIIEYHARLMTDHDHQVQVIAGRGSQFDERIPFVYLPMIDSRHEDILAIKQDLDRGVVSEAFHKRVATIEMQLIAHIADEDVLVAHNVCSLNKNLPLTAALFNISRKVEKPRMILWHHDLAWTTPRYQKELHEGYPWNLLKTEWNAVTQVTISEARRSELAGLMKLDERQITVIPNGVDVERVYKLEKKTREFIEKLDLLQASPLLLLPVRITPRKNIELGLRVLACLRKDYPFATLVVTGPLGPHNPSNVQYFERLRALRSELGLSDSAHFLAELADGYIIPDPVISDFYRMADALFLPSTEEGFGIPILEAGISGIPVFCSDIPPLRELAGEFASYFSVDENPQTIAAMICKYCSNNKIFQFRAKVQAQYAWWNIYEAKIEPLLKG